jgi:hypothetical protein
MIKELPKLLREQQDAIDNDSDPLVLEQNDKEIWALRNKYACGSTWGKDPAFDKWWVKQVAKARNLNMVRQTFMWIAIAMVAIFLVINAKHEQDVIKNMTDEQYENYVEHLDTSDHP